MHGRAVDAGTVLIAIKGDPVDQTGEVVRQNWTVC